ncbi:hypothetical protein DFQ04_2547 [Algoriphagus boseongensis]|uniref:Lipoprotein n=1 Tax=Algoriphagus boseongensis TaxID=1442587 RepID=A0A4R6T573_9BACT|nr:hypothetical protein [Algoriphagus boseongensis]TDQ16429.1 hypothetical protein DFQ04_2547 [Algoriphagus boseongensis]
MRILRNSLSPFFVGLALIFSSCEEDPIPVIPDPDNPTVEKPILPPNFTYFTLQISQNLLCPGEASQITIKDGNNKVRDLKEFTFYLSPAIGTVNVEKGVYQAPSNLDSAVNIALWAVHKTDTTYKPGKFLRIVPSDPDSKLLRDFNGISASVDTKQLPGGSLVFATNSPSDPPGIFPYSEFEIFSTDQQGQLLWKNNLGKGILRRLIIGKEVIYGLGYLEEFVAVKFDFKGNHIGTYSLELGSEKNYQLLENLKGAVDEQDELFIAYGTYDLKWLKKIDSDGKVGDSKPINFFAEDFFVLENSKLVFTSEGISNGFVVTDLDLKVLWNMNFGVKARIIQVGNSQEIWSISRTASRFEYLLTRFDPNGKQISSKLFRLTEGVDLLGFYDLVQLPNQSIWLVGSGAMNVSQAPINDEQFNFRFYLVNISPEGENLKEVPIQSLNFQVPYLPGGWPTKFHGLFQGSAGMMLAGHWFYNFLVQLGPNYTYSQCQGGN